MVKFVVFQLILRIGDDRMTLLRATEINVEREGKEIVKNASIEIKHGEHIALIGNNGKGKTTLLKVLIGQIQPTGGRISVKPAPEEWAWLEQDPIVDKSITTREWVELENPHLMEMKKQMNTLMQSMEAQTDFETTSVYNEVLQNYIDHDGYGWEMKVERQLNKLGINESFWNQPYHSLSGGQKTKVQLARILVKDTSLLIMDEPTNHLDMETMSWLAKWLQSFKGAVLIVSHDRAFIDQVADSTYELTDYGTKKYKGGYKKYKEQKDQELLTLEAAYKKQEQERKQLLEAISNYRQWFTKAHNSASERDPFAKKKANKNMTRLQAKEAALERIDKNRIEKPKEESSIHVNFQDSAFSSKGMLYFKNVSFGYGSDKIINDVSFFLERGDRIGVIGPNGAGKSTLLRLLTKEVDCDLGEIYHHPQLKIGFFKQELDNLPREQTVLDYILSIPNMTQSEARTILACFLFPREDVFKKISNLSMGEKCRVAFVKLYFSEANLLVLDEPTNYLDIMTREKIEEALELYPGAVVLVSHDQYLIQKVSNRILSLKDGFTIFQGTYKEFKESINGKLDDIEKQKELQSLKLQFSILLSEEVSDETEHMEKIRELKARIDVLES